MPGRGFEGDGTLASARVLATGLYVGHAIGHTVAALPLGQESVAVLHTAIFQASPCARALLNNPVATRSCYSPAAFLK